MRLLSLDTSFSSVNLTLIEDGRVVLHHYVDDGKKTLEHLPLLLTRLGIQAQEMDAFAVSLGVGYLTPLRIGITFMKTIAYLSQRPIVGYENLSLMCEFTKNAKKVALKVSHNIFCKSCKEGNIEVLKDPEGLSQVVGLEDLVFFPFSLHGGLWAYRKLREGYIGDDPIRLEPIYLRDPT
ncbi:MAG: tRNA threonylcarbamoyladenosine biosynthesis protein TsaB [Aquificaceae bacterium]